MKQTPKLFVIVDPEQDEDQPVIRRAALLAEAMSADIHLFSSCAEHGINLGKFHAASGGEKARQERLKTCEQLLTNTCDQLQQQSLRCQWSVNSSVSLSEAVIDLVKEIQPTFVLKESRLHRKMSRTFFHRTDWDLIKQCPVPLWLVKSGVWSEGGCFIACIDPMHQNDPKANIDSRVLRLSSELASSLNSRVDVFHSLEPLAEYAKPFVIDTIVETARSKHEEKLLDFLSDFDIETGQLHMKEGFPETVLNELVLQLNGAVVVIGALARHGVNSMLLGSTAQRVLDKVTCDVLVVKPDDFG